MLDPGFAGAAIDAGRPGVVSYLRFTGTGRP